MSLSRPSALCLLAWAALFHAPPLQAEPAPADRLEEPYSPDKPAEPATNPAPPPLAPPSGQVSAVIDDPTPPVDTRPRPVRARRRLALTGELGWNGLAGFGPVLGYHLNPHLTFELGMGLSLTGLKGGVRGRFNLLTGPVTPFIGAGLTGTTGLGVVTLDLEDPEDKTEHKVTARIRPTPALQTVIGIDWTNARGFTLVSALGYSAVLNDNYDVIAGELSKDERRAFDIIFGSGPVVSVAAGYSF